MAETRSTGATAPMLRRAAPLLGAVLVAILGSAFLLRSDYHNPFDEHSHFDYVVKIASDFRIPPIGDELGQLALQEWACSGEPPFAGLTCGAATQDPALAPWSGISPATGYPVVPYLPTAIVTRVLHTTFGGLSWLDSARIASMLWLVGLAALLVAVGQRLGGPTAAVLAGAVFLSSMPQVLIQGVTVGNDVPAVFMSVLTVWLWLRLKEAGATRRRVWTTLVACLALLTKQHAVIALLVVATLEMGLVLQSRDGSQVPGPEDQPEGQRWASWRGLMAGALPAAGMVGAAVLGFLLVSYFVDPVLRGPRVETPGMIDVIRSSEPQDFGLAAAKAYSSIGSVFQAPSWVAGLNSAWPQLIASLGASVLLGGVAFAVLRTCAPWREEPLGVLRQITGLYLLLFPAAFLVYLKAMGSPLFSQPRYYLIGMAFAALAFFPQVRRAWAWFSLAGAICVWAIMLTSLMALPPA